MKIIESAAKKNKLVVGNMKMNILSPLERERYLATFQNELEKKILERTEIVLCPPFIHIEKFFEVLGKGIKIGAQEIFWEREGSFTGEISPAMVKNFGGEYAIIGHSERRRYFGETDELANLRVAAALKIGLKAVICVGETAQEKKSGQTLRIVTNQVKMALKNINRTKAHDVIITYEPVWAVGSDAVPTSNEIMEAKLLIKKILVALWEKRYAEHVKILYGGSVSAKTVKEVCIDAAMDGVLVGRESLVPYEFIKIAEIINN